MHEASQHGTTSGRMRTGQQTCRGGHTKRPAGRRLFWAARTVRGSRKPLKTSEAVGARTQDLRIKSPLLYQLSYSLKLFLSKHLRYFLVHAVVRAYCTQASAPCTTNLQQPVPAAKSGRAEGEKVSGTFLTNHDPLYASLP